MLRFYLRLTFVPVMLFTIALLLIRTQSYDDHELLPLWLQESCHAPCFLGIRPGVTTVDEAIKLLEASGWVALIKYQKGDSIMSIKWNSNIPVWMETDGMYSSFFITDGLVTDFRLVTNLSLGDIQLILGKPSFQYALRGNIDGITFLSYSSAYPSFGLIVNVSNTCQGQNNDIGFQDKVALVFVHLPYVQDLKFQYNSSWKDLLRISCD